jgi:hypothetical protein
LNTKPPEASAPEEAPGSAPGRKPYTTPRLQAYGDLADITKANSKGSKNDGGAFGTHKTAL